MRSELRTLLSKLDDLGVVVRRDVDDRVNQFRYTGANTIESETELNLLLGRFFLNLVTPKGRSSSGEETGIPAGHAKSLLRKEYGANYSDNLLRYVSTSADGGVRGMLDKLSEAFFLDQVDGGAGLDVSKFWEQFQLGESYRNLNQDAQAYIQVYGHMLSLIHI